MKITVLLVLAALILTGAARLRGPEYDEAYSIFLTAGDARPAWPDGVFQATDVRGFYHGPAGFGRIARDLRQGDVHPPLYFWCLDIWRLVFGSGWFTARLLSVVFSLGALAGLAWLAMLAEFPVVPALLIAMLSYGFVYTGSVARGFALAQMLNVLGAACSMAAGKRNRPGWAAVGGLAFGAASFSNYLAVFTGVSVIAWLGGRSWRLFAAAAAGLAVFLPADAWFFWAQKSSRDSQFDIFSPGRAVVLLGKDFGAAMFGGLPVYAGRAGPAVAVALALLFAMCVGFAYKNRRPGAAMFAVAAFAMPVGLLALGFAFNKTPIEIRYLAFSIPFVALLLANLPRSLLATLLTVQAGAILGLMLAPVTMQPHGRAATQAALLETPGTLVLLAYGNDGVGVPGPFIAVAPDDLRIELVRAGLVPDLRQETRLIVASINADAASRSANATLLGMLAADHCWREITGLSLARVFVRTCRAN